MQLDYHHWCVSAHLTKQLLKVKLSHTRSYTIGYYIIIFLIHCLIWMILNHYHYTSATHPSPCQHTFCQSKSQIHQESNTKTIINNPSETFKCSHIYTRPQITTILADKELAQAKACEILLHLPALYAHNQIHSDGLFYSVLDYS